MGDTGRKAVEKAVDGRRLVIYEGGGRCRGGGERRVLDGEEHGTQRGFGKGPRFNQARGRVQVLSGTGSLALVARAQRVFVGHGLPVAVFRIVGARRAEVRLDGRDFLGMRPVLVNLLLPQSFVVTFRGRGRHGGGRLGVPIVLVHDPLVLSRPFPNQTGAGRGERFRQWYHGYLGHRAVVVPHVPHVETLPAHHHP